MRWREHNGRTACTAGQCTDEHCTQTVGGFGDVRTENTCHRLGTDKKQLAVTCRSWKWLEFITTQNPNKSCIPQWKDMIEYLMEMSFTQTHCQLKTLQSKIPVHENWVEWAFYTKRERSWPVRWYLTVGKYIYWQYRRKKKLLIIFNNSKNTFFDWQFIVRMIMTDDEDTEIKHKRHT